MSLKTDHIFRPIIKKTNNLAKLIVYIKHYNDKCKGTGVCVSTLNELVYAKV